MRAVVAIAAAGLLAAACNLPFLGPSLASTSQLINGAGDSLARASGFEISGAFDGAAGSYTLNLKYTAPTTAHVAMTQNNLQFEFIQVDGKVYYRGKDFIASQVGSNAGAQKILHAVGDRWFSSASVAPIDMSAFTDAAKVKATFLQNFTVARKDNVSSSGIMTAELSADSYILNITEASPHRLVYLRTAPGKTVSNFTNTKLAFSNYNKSFGTVAPANVFDLDDHATWPPIYTAVSVENSRCSDPCVLSAVLRNDGGLTGAPAPSTVTFSVLDSSNNTLGNCKVTISPDIPNGKQVTESCSISSTAWTNYTGSTYKYEAVPDNPAYD
ncbi:MAG TPA: hypothetical protein VGU71_12900 [Candidatus Dormibacteraeota bacterium]|nr:hypothetical protein [Candidatus Dormibacteraeota bacterium]